jgi:hypothetical protein
LGFTFPENLKDSALMQSALEKAWAMPHPPIITPDARGYYAVLRGAMGDDVGLSTYSVLSFELFGRRVSSLYYSYFGVIAISILLYVLSHWRSAAAMTALALAMMALYVVASSDLINFTRKIGYFAGQSGLDLKDPRFLSTLALFPVLHIAVGWLRPQHRFGALDLVTLAGQAAILAFAVHVRASTQWVLIALALLWLVVVGLAWYRERRWSAALLQPGSSFSLIGVSTIVLIVATGHFTAMLVAHPLYKLHGDRLTHPFWRGMYYSLQDNPDWAAKYGATVDGVTGDEMPVVAVKKVIAKLPAEQQRQYMGRYDYPTMEALEKFSKMLFFDLVKNDPKFIYDTYFVARYRLLEGRLRFFYGSLRQTTGAWQMAGLVGSMFVLALVSSGERKRLALLAAFTGIAAVFGFISVLPNWLVSVEENVMIDHFVWAITFGLAATTLIAAVLMRAVRQALPVFVSRLRAT